MTSEVMDDLTEKLEKALDAGLGENCLDALKKQVSNIIYDIETDIDYRLKEELAYNLSVYAKEMAEKSVVAILQGNEGELARYLSCAPGYWNGRESDHSVIHGTLFETGPLELRKRIVEAHADFLKTQRILDLESQVESLVRQLNSAKSSIENMGRELADYRRQL